MTDKATDVTVTQADYDPDFVEAWTAHEDAGFIYSESNIAKVYLGWQMARTTGCVETPGRFAEYSNDGLAAQCRMQARESLDPDYSQFMTAVADRLAALSAPLGEVERLREALDRIEATLDAAERTINASPFWDENSRYAGKALLGYPRSQIAAERAALAQPEAGGELSAAKGVPISDWSWWAGSDETVKEDGLYDLYEAGSRADLIEWAECHVNPGDRFHIIEARTRALQADDEFMPFVAKRNHASFVIDDAGTAVEIPAAQPEAGGER